MEAISKSGYISFRTGLFDLSSLYSFVSGVGDDDDFQTAATIDPPRPPVTLNFIFGT